MLWKARIKGKESLARRSGTNREQISQTWQAPPAKRIRETRTSTRLPDVEGKELAAVALSPIRLQQDKDEAMPPRTSA